MVNYNLDKNYENQQDISKEAQNFSTPITNLLSVATIFRSSFMSVETNCCTPSEGSTTSFSILMLRLERDCMIFEPFTIVLATSKDKIESSLFLVVTPETNPLGFKLVMVLPSVSNTSTALSSPAEPAFPKSELTSETCNVYTPHSKFNKKI